MTSATKLKAGISFIVKKTYNKTVIDFNFGRHKPALNRTYMYNCSNRLMFLCDNIKFLFVCAFSVVVLIV